MSDAIQTTDDRLARARLSLEGLSVGDAFGERFFVASPALESIIAKRVLTAGPWTYSDDTLMALSVFEILRRHGEIRQDELARSFGQRYQYNRGYGPAMHRLLERVRLGADWRTASRSLFEGQGSWGNGAAMRIAPLGAYLAYDPALAAKQAALSAEVTHGHPEAQSGAAAVAAAAALAWQMNQKGADYPSRPEFIASVMEFVPDGLVRAKLRLARDLAEGCSVRLAVEALGNGTEISAADTVPFVLWCAGERLDSYEEALWLTVSGLGDRDTTCAMVGGIVALSSRTPIPTAWVGARETLPSWPFEA